MGPVAQTKFWFRTWSLQMLPCLFDVETNLVLCVVAELLFA